MSGTTDLELLRKRLRSNRLPSDVFCGILFYAVTDELEQRAKISSRSAPLHATVFALQQEKEYQSLIGDFAFDTQNYFPFSRLLDSVLTQLVAAKYLAFDPKEAETYTINVAALKRGFEETKDALYSKDDLAILQHMGGDFCKALQENEHKRW